MIGRLVMAGPLYMSILIGLWRMYSVRSYMLGCFGRFLTWILYNTRIPYDKAVEVMLLKVYVRV